MADTDFKAEALVPIWVEKSGVSALDKMAQRPVLIDVESLGRAFRGQMLHMTMSAATVLPDDPFLIWKSLPVKVSFRYGDVVYALTGMSTASDSDLSFSINFDNVTRKSLVILSKNLGEAGLLDAADVEQMFAAKNAEAVEAEAKPAQVEKKSKISARLVRHEKPPGGRERRIHHRYDLDVAGKLAVVNSDFNFGCSMLELSLGGCRVYTEFPNTIEVETQVEVQFIECGFPLRLPARIQVKNGAHILGLKYLEMSSRMRERLINLINEVAEREMGSGA